MRLLVSLGVLILVCAMYVIVIKIMVVSIHHGDWVDFFFVFTANAVLSLILVAGAQRGTST